MKRNHCHKVMAENIFYNERIVFATLKECAEYFHTTRQYIYEMIKSGRKNRTGWVFDYL